MPLAGGVKATAATGVAGEAASITLAALAGAGVVAALAAAAALVAAGVEAALGGSGVDVTGLLLDATGVEADLPCNSLVSVNMQGMQI
jgi:hypothetical protein